MCFCFCFFVSLAHNASQITSKVSQLEAFEQQAEANGDAEEESRGDASLDCVHHTDTETKRDKTPRKVGREPKRKRSTFVEFKRKKNRRQRFENFFELDRLRHAL